MQVEALFELIKGLIKDLDGSLHDEVGVVFVVTYSIAYLMTLAFNVIIVFSFLSSLFMFSPNFVICIVTFVAICIQPSKNYIISPFSA